MPAVLFADEPRKLRRQLSETGRKLLSQTFSPASVGGGHAPNSFHEWLRCCESRVRVEIEPRELLLEPFLQSIEMIIVNRSYRMRFELPQGRGDVTQLCRNNARYTWVTSEEGQVEQWLSYGGKLEAQGNPLLDSVSQVLRALALVQVSDMVSLAASATPSTSAGGASSADNAPADPLTQELTCSSGDAEVSFSFFVSAEGRPLRIQQVLRGVDLTVTLHFMDSFPIGSLTPISIPPGIISDTAVVINEVTGALKQLNSSARRRIHRVFEEIDADRDGLITEADVVQTVTKAGLSTPDAQALASRMSAELGARTGDPAEEFGERDFAAFWLSSTCFAVSSSCSHAEIDESIAQLEAVFLGQSGAFADGLSDFGMLGFEGGGNPDAEAVASPQSRGRYAAEPNSEDDFSEMFRRMMEAATQEK